ncbi:MAG: hypothetical protein JO048_02395 [Methylobacteriaceae bacterium]|nr:hypothetical protein [Methylobacteriaceae bacterium]
MSAAPSRPAEAHSSGAPSLAVRLYGTEEPVATPRRLTAGPLTAELEAGNLRYIRFHGHELLRAVSFIVRDRNWGTYNPEIRDLTVEESPDGFHVSYEATASDARQGFRYRARITGGRDGRLAFEAEGEALTDFDTNRTGFVVLHSGEGVAGRPVRVEHVDGRVVDSAFPDLIDPVQPMMNLRALTHEAAPGLAVTCRMEGDTFEMEDQRNWTDASFKTYVRPLALPWPYRLAAGTTLAQAVTVTVEDRGVRPAPSGAAVTLRLGAESGRVPRLGLGLDPADLDDAEAARGLLADLAPAYLVCRHDPRAGHDGRTLARVVALARALGAEPWLEAVVVAVELAEAEQEIAALGRVAAAMGQPFAIVLVSPAPDLTCTLPGSPWPPCPPLEGLYRAARAAFPGSRIGGGMFSYFTELNRKRPPRDELDFVTFTTSAVVHAGDDRSVMEGLGALPFIAASARAIAGDTPYVVGPSAIGMRDNPYGDAPMPNPGNIRQAMSFNDPRQRGLLGAAWSLAYFAHFARGGAAAVALGGLVGAFGAVHARRPWPAPFFDEAGGRYPVFHVLRGLARLGHAPMIEVAVSSPSLVGALCARRGEGRELWLANLGPEPREVAIEGFGPARGAILEAERFGAAATHPQLLDRLEPLSGVALGPYAVARLVADS